MNPQLSQDGNGRSEVYPFSPQGLRTITPFTHGKDWQAALAGNEWGGKVTHPAVAEAFGLDYTPVDQALAG